MEKVVVIGSSTGGPSVLERLLSKLPEKVNVPVIVIQHMPGTFTRSLAERLDKICPLTVSQAREGEMIEKDHVYVIPGDFHFFFEKPGPRVRLLYKDKGLSPSVDMGMVSAVDHYGPGVIGVILSGMGRDGSIGAKAIKQIGGLVLAESKESATIYGMSREVIEAGLADEVLPIDKIPSKIIELLKK